MEYYLYETNEKERWDSIAEKFYGDCYKITPLIETNYHVPISTILKTKTELRVPKQDSEENNLPEWKKE